MDQAVEASFNIVATLGSQAVFHGIGWQLNLSLLKAFTLSLSKGTFVL